MLDGLQRALLADQEVGDDAQHLAAGLVGGARGRAHQAHAAAAVDQPQVRRGQRAAEIARGAQVGRVRGVG